MHATARLSNVQRALYVWLDAQVAALPDAPALVLEDAARPAAAAPWLRAIVQPLPGRRTGRFDADHAATAAAVLLVVDLFWPRDRDAYAISLAAETLADALDQLSLELKDYSADPAAPTTIEGARLRQIEPAPAAQRLDLEAEWSRSQVRARFTWTARRSA